MGVGPGWLRGRRPARIPLMVGRVGHQSTECAGPGMMGGCPPSIWMAPRSQACGTTRLGKSRVSSTGQRGAPVASVGSFTLNLAGVVTAQRGQSGPARWGKLDAVAGRAGHPEGLDRPCWTGPGQWTGPAGMTRAVGSRRPCWPQMAPTCGHVGARVCPQWLGVARTPIDVDAL